MFLAFKSQKEKKITKRAQKDKIQVKSFRLNFINFGYFLFKYTSNSFIILSRICCVFLFVAHKTNLRIKLRVSLLVWPVPKCNFLK